MIQLLARVFIKNQEDVENPKVRQAYGVLCGTVGIVLNMLLFAGKWLAGFLSGSIAITADAFNNLSDAGSAYLDWFSSVRTETRSEASLWTWENGIYFRLICICGNFNYGS